MRTIFQGVLSRFRLDRNGYLVECQARVAEFIKSACYISSCWSRRTTLKVSLSRVGKTIHMLPLAATLAAGERPGKPGAEKQARPESRSQNKSKYLKRHLQSIARLTNPTHTTTQHGRQTFRGSRLRPAIPLAQQKTGSDRRRPSIQAPLHRPRIPEKGYGRSLWTEIET